MVTVKFTEDKEAKTISLKVTGHAGQAESGKDIVCASASILLYTVAQYAMFAYEKHHLKKKPLVSLGDGDAEVIITPKSDHYGEALHTFFVAQIGYTLLARNYPQYVELTSFE